MATIIENALKGRQKAMEALYKENRQTVFSVARILLSDEKQAQDALIWTFKEIWNEIFAPMTEEAFAAAAIGKAASYCKERIARREPKAFRAPANKNFRVSFSDCVYDGKENYGEFALRQLPKLQQFLFVLHEVCGLDSAQAAGIVGLNQKTATLLCEAVRSNVESLIQETGAAVSYDKLVESFKEDMRRETSCGKADEQILAFIDEAARPAEQKRKKRNLFLGAAAGIICLCIVVGVIFAFQSNRADKPEGESRGDVVEGTEDGGQNESVTYYADIEIQDYGKITVALDQKSAPITVKNFVDLAKSGFYNGLTFHRIMEGFMMQGGDPDGNGLGGSEQTIVGEFSQNGYENPLSHTRGAISMARSNDFDSASSQFFIVHEDSTFLDGEYAAFGYVTEGMDVVDAVCEAAEPTDGNGTISPEDQPVITAVTIRTE